MMASVFIKNGNIYFYNEGDSFLNIGGIAYELGKPILNFLCYNQERFAEAIYVIASAFEVPGADIGMHSPEFKSAITEQVKELQKNDPYIYFFYKAFIEGVYSSILPNKISQQISLDFKNKQKFMINQVNFVMKFREVKNNIKDEISTIEVPFAPL